MIQSAPVPATASRLANGLVFLLFFPATEVAASAAEPGTVAVFWAPPVANQTVPEVKAAFADATRPMGARLVDASPTRLPLPAASLVPDLEAGKSAYERFDFADTIARLSALERRAEHVGGGDLDRRQLAEIFLYRGLARLETPPAESAWDDLVQAARLDPGRALDPARFPPRAVAAYRRASTEVGEAPRAELALEVPSGATVRIDGAPSPATAPVTFGTHFVAVTSEAHEPWGGMVQIATSRTRFTPPLRPYQPPQGDKLIALAGPKPPGRLLLGALERNDAGWQFTLRDITLPEGRYSSDTVRLGEIPSRAAVHGLVRRLDSAPPRARWVPWAVAGCAVLVTAASVAYLVARDGSSPNVVGELGSWR